MNLTSQIGAVGGGSRRRAVSAGSFRELQEEMRKSERVTSYGACQLQLQQQQLLRRRRRRQQQREDRHRLCMRQAVASAMAGALATSVVSKEETRKGTDKKDKSGKREGDRRDADRVKAMLSEVRMSSRMRRHNAASSATKPRSRLSSSSFSSSLSSSSSSLSRLFRLSGSTSNAASDSAASPVNLSSWALANRGIDDYDEDGGGCVGTSTDSLVFRRVSDVGGSLAKRASEALRRRSDSCLDAIADEIDVAESYGRGDTRGVDACGRFLSENTARLSAQRQLPFGRSTSTAAEAALLSALSRLGDEVYDRRRPRMVDKGRDECDMGGNPAASSSSSVFVVVNKKGDGAVASASAPMSTSSTSSLSFVRTLCFSSLEMEVMEKGAC